MSACNTCRQPGACCRGFVLSTGSLPAETWHADAVELMVKHRLPFRPKRAFLSGADLPDESRLQVEYDCPRLGADGRCTDYYNRPETCRVYQPGEDRMCVEHVNQFRGIPIAVLPPPAQQQKIHYSRASGEKP